MSSSRSLTRSGLIKLFSLLFVLAGGMTALEAQESPNQGNVSISGSVNYTTDYYFRGYEQETDGFIIQPGASLSATLYEGTGSLSLNGGIWNSYHSEETGATTADDDLDSLYETDYYTGLSYGYGDFSFGFQYIAFTYPNNNGAATIEELDYTVSYDDSDLLGDFALSPSIKVGQEIDNPGSDESVYGEFGISPGYTFAEDSNYPISVSLPTTFGLSLDDYYTDPADDDEEFLGFVSIGPHASVPLASKSQWGTWTLSAGVDWLLLTSDAVETADPGNDSSEVIGSISLGMSY